MLVYDTLFKALPTLRAYSIEHHFKTLHLETSRRLGRRGVFGGIFKGKKFIAASAGEVYFVLSIRPFVAGRLPGVIHAHDLMAFA
jgi:hypothetical protein